MSERIVTPHSESTMSASGWGSAPYGGDRTREQERANLTGKRSREEGEEAYDLGGPGMRIEE